MKLASIFLVMILCLSFVVSAQTAQTIDSDKLGVIEVDVQPKGPIEQIFDFFTSPFAIKLSTATPKVGESFDIQMFPNIACHNSNPDEIKLNILKNNNLYDTIDLSGFITTTGLGTCMTGQFNFNNVVIDEADSYTAILVIFAEDGYQLSKDVLNFDVVSESPEHCPEDFCSDWEVFANDPNGIVEIRQCFTYSGGFPSCDLVLDRDYLKTTCDSGYVIEGTNQRNADGDRQCVSEEVTESSIGDFGEEEVPGIEPIVCGQGEIRQGTECVAESTTSVTNTGAIAEDVWTIFEESPTSCTKTTLTSLETDSRPKIASFRTQQECSTALASGESIRVTCNILSEVDEQTATCQIDTLRVGLIAGGGVIAILVFLFTSGIVKNPFRKKRRKR